MSEIDPDDMSPGLRAFIFAFIGGGLVTFGMVVSIFFWPAGLVMFALGGIVMFASPFVWWTARREKRREDAESPPA